MGATKQLFLQEQQTSSMLDADYQYQQFLQKYKTTSLHIKKRLSKPSNKKLKNILE